MPRKRSVPFNGANARKTGDLESPYRFVPSRLVGADSQPTTTRLSAFHRKLICKVIESGYVLGCETVSDFGRWAIEKALTDLVDDGLIEISDVVADGVKRLKLAIEDAERRAASANVSRLTQELFKSIRYHLDADDPDGAADAWLRAEDQINTLLAPGVRSYAMNKLLGRMDFEDARDRAMQLKARGVARAPFEPVSDSSVED